MVGSSSMSVPSMLTIIYSSTINYVIKSFSHIVVTCPMLTNPMNGMIDCSLGDDGVLSYEDTCTATCDTGYMLTGDAMRTCQSDGMFTGIEAMCSRGKLCMFNLHCVINSN